MRLKARPWMLGVAGLALGVMALFGLRWLGTSAQAAPKSAPPPPLVETVQPEALGREYTVDARGFVRPAHRVEIVPEVAGKLHYLHESLRVGGQVDQGEILFTLDPATFEADLARREAELSRARARLERAQSERERKVYLAERGGVSESQAELAVADEKTRDANLAVAKAAVEVARERLRDTVLRAPFDAVVEDESASPGAFVSSSSSVLTLVERGSAELEVGVPRGEARGVRRAMGARSTPLRAVVRQGALERRAIVRGIAPSVDARSQTVTFILEIDRRADADALFYGALGQVELPARATASLFAVPEVAIRKGGFVWGVDDENRLHRIDVRPVRLAGERSLVTGALESVERIVLTRLTEEADGMEIRVRAEPSS